MSGVKIEGGIGITTALQGFIDRFAGNEKRLLRALGVGLLGVVKDHFDQEQAPDGRAWVKSRRVQAGEQLKTLQDSRILFNSLTWTVDTSGDLEVGSPLEYAAIHNFGGEIRPKPGKKALHFGGITVKKVVMPKRQFLGWGQTEETQVQRDLKALAASLSREGT